MNEKIKVMIIDDSIFQRIILQDIINSDTEKRFEVIASAIDTEDALQKLHAYEVDVISLDIHLKYSEEGFQLLEEIMKQKPTPVLLFSSYIKDNSPLAEKGIEKGAIQVMNKPIRQNKNEDFQKEYLKNLFAVSQSSKNKSAISQPIIPKKILYHPTKLTNLIAIGSSTGGTDVLHQLLSNIPKDFPAGIVIVQHINKKFTRWLAESLDKDSSFEVVEASNENILTDGKVIIAKGDFHLEVFNRNNDFYAISNQKEYVKSLRPSVDVLFNSLARLDSNIPIYAVVLTGIGDDGTDGSHALKRKGATIITQDEKDCVVYGMPKRVVEKGLSDYQERTHSIIPRIQELIKQKNLF